MKQKNLFKIHLPILFFNLLILTSFSCTGEKKNTIDKAQGISTNINLSSEKSTFLYCRASTIEGKLEVQAGDNMTWEGNAKMEWEINVPENEEYELYLIANIRNEATGEKLSFKTDEKTYGFELTETKGPYIGGRNFQRVLLASEVDLKKGIQKVALLSEGISKEGVLIDIRSIELLPVSAKNKIKAERERAIASRTSIEWLKETGYGLMFHWTSQSVQRDGSIKKYEDAVNDFDVAKFAHMVEETGAGYVMLTIGHAESYCPAPIRSWEKVHPGHTTQRDLIEEIANALNSKGIKLICYINGPLGFNLPVKTEPSTEEKQAFIPNFKNILSEMGNRYQNKIAGYWFDSWYQIFERFPEVPFEEFNEAAKTGNKDRIICLNSWIYPSVTPWQDYWAGEVASPIKLPENGYMKNGPVPDLPYQALLIMEPYWVQQKAEMPHPRFTSESLSEYIVN
ncbi:alpha-L-fucosidase, partial [Draconibacterium sp.]|nr:alpha-L-fucosidase [Draconibacterium sp.]